MNGILEKVQKGKGGNPFFPFLFLYGKRKMNKKAKNTSNKSKNKRKNDSKKIKIARSN